MANVTEASKCNKLADRMEMIRLELEEIREKFNAINYDKLDAEEDDDWDSDLVEEYIMDLDTATNALEGVI